MRTRFNRSAIASSDGVHVRVQHDRRANTTGRTDYMFCGKPVVITAGSVFDKTTGKWLGHLHIDDYGGKYVYGPLNKGRLLTN